MVKQKWIDQFNKALDEELEAARQSGLPYKDIVARELHTKVIPLSVANRMPICCDAMKKGHRRYEIISAPPSGKGSLLTIRYSI